MSRLIRIYTVCKIFFPCLRKGLRHFGIDSTGSDVTYVIKINATVKLSNPDPYGDRKKSKLPVQKKLIPSYD